MPARALSPLGFVEQRAFQKFCCKSLTNAHTHTRTRMHTHTKQYTFPQREAKSIANTSHRFHLHSFDVESEPLRRRERSISLLKAWTHMHESKQALATHTQTHKTKAGAITVSDLCRALISHLHYKAEEVWNRHSQSVKWGQLLGLTTGLMEVCVCVCVCDFHCKQIDWCSFTFVALKPWFGQTHSAPLWVVKAWIATHRGAFGLRFHLLRQASSQRCLFFFF